MEKEKKEILARAFIDRLINDSGSLVADRFELERNQGQTDLTFFQQKKNVRRIPVEAVWYDLVKNDLLQNSARWIEDLAEAKSLLLGTSETGYLVSFVEDVVTPRSEKLTVSLIKKINRKALWQEFLFPVELSDAQKIIVGLSAPEQEQDLRILLTRIGGISVDQISFSNTGDFVALYREQATQCQAGTYLATMALARKVCPLCARETPVDKHKLAELPESLRQTPFVHYRVGRGCQSCHERGYYGRLCVSSGFLFNAETSVRFNALLAGGDDALCAGWRTVGIKSLCEEGVAQVQRGALSLEGLFAVRPTHPPYFERQGISKEAARSKKLLLLVEDDPDQREILEMVFRGAQYDVLSAVNGAEGFKLAEQHQPNIIVTDLMMPEVDGATLVKQLKEQQSLAHIPILVLTVLGDSDKQVALFDLGADDYVEKTVQRKVLLKRVERLLRA